MQPLNLIANTEPHTGPQFAIRDPRRKPMTFTARQYLAGDEVRLVDLWQRTYAHLGGFIPRTPAHWLWAVLQRPGMTCADIRLIVSDGEIIAYGAIGPGGAILEFAVEPLLKPRKRALAFELLLRALERQARERNYDFVSCAAPVADRFIAKQMRKAGYHTDEGVFASLAMINPLEVIRRILYHRRAHFLGWHQTFLLELTPGSYRELPQTRLSIDISEELVVEDRSLQGCDPPQCRLSTDLTTLTDVLFGSVPARRCLANGQIRVVPAAKFSEALRLLELLSIQAPWQVPTSDVF